MAEGRGELELARTKSDWARTSEVLFVLWKAHFKIPGNRTAAYYNPFADAAARRPSGGVRLTPAALADWGKSLPKARTKKLKTSSPSMGVFR